MVSMSVLTLIFGLMTQMIGTVSRDSRYCQQRVNNFTKSRALLDILTQDLKAALYRDDLAFYPAGSETNLAFYTQRSDGGSGSTRNLTLVQYAIDPASGTSNLNRSSLAVNWASTSSDVSFGDATNLPSLSQVTSYEAAPGVVGFQVHFLLSDGTIQSTYTNSASNPLRAVGVTLAVLDDQSMALLTPSELASLQAQLAAAAPANAMVKEAWETALNQGSIGAGIPHAVNASIHVFERFVYVLPSF